jgi:putative ABC transport system substrate-binding protein
VHQVGFLTTGSDSVERLRQALRQQGYVEGPSLALEVRVGPVDQLPALAAELVALPVDVLVASSATTAQAAKSVTSTTPIAFIESSDPIGQGLVASLARPGGNATGVSTLNTVIVSKQLELLKVAVPTIASVGVLGNAHAPLDSPWQVEPLAFALGIQPKILDMQGVTGAGDLEASLASAGGMQVDALLAIPSLSLIRARIAALALDRRLPLMSARRSWAEVGALMSYGPSLEVLYRRAAY